LIQDELLEIKSFSSPAVAVLTVLEQSPTLSCSRSKTDRQSFPLSQRMATMPYGSSQWLARSNCLFWRCCSGTNSVVPFSKISDDITDLRHCRVWYPYICTTQRLHFTSCVCSCTLKFNTSSYGYSTRPCCQNWRET